MKLQDEPTDNLNNGQVTLELTITDEVSGLGILTELTGFEATNGVTEELAEHIWDEYRIDVEEHGVEIYD